MNPSPSVSIVQYASKRPKRPVVKRKSFKRVTRGRGTKKRVVRQKTLTWYKKELDRVFSIYIRTKYPKVCYTCNKPGTLQNGHFIVRKYLATRWEEDNCRPQCVGCNIYGKGMTIDFEENLIRDLGAERVQEMKDKRKELWKLTQTFYEEQITLYKEKVDNLQNTQ